MIGRTFSHYTVLEEAGRGGMGVVYRAEDTDLRRDVALKFLPADIDRMPGARERFVNEARAAAALNHPNICTIHEIGVFDETPFIAMEFIDGPSLRERIDAGPLPVDESLDIAIQAAEGLFAAHEKGIVHRDIKSSNIMINASGRPVIMDFGLAKSADRTQLTTEGTTLGTAAYMSPEQAGGQEADNRSDIWSLGVVLYEMITGRQPFEGEHHAAVVYSIVHREPERLSGLRSGVSDELQSVIDRCLAKDPGKRYQTAADLASDLRNVRRQQDGGRHSGTVRGSARENRHPGLFQAPMRRGLWLLILCVPVIAFLIIRVIAPAYFSGDAPGTTPDKKLAVLPFVNLGEPGEEYFADGITEELIARLAGVEGLGVIARTSAMRYKDADMTIGEIGEELEVDYILEGTIRWQKMPEGRNRVRITPQLIRVSDETHVWAEVYQRDMTDIFIIQDEIAGNVVNSLDVTLGALGRKSISGGEPTDNIAAYQAYLEARFWWNKRSKEGFARAIVLFDEAIDIDPGYALAYSGKAEAYVMMAIHLARPAEYIETARKAAGKAVELDGSLAQAYAALGWIGFVYDYEFDEAERLFKKAIELDPGYATAYNWYGVMLSMLGRDEEAIDLMTRAHQLDPASMIIGRDRACVLSWAGRFDDAKTQLEKVLAMDPAFLPALAHLGRIYTAEGRYDEAYETFEKLRAIDGNYFNLDVMLGHLYAKSGRIEESRRILADLISRSDSQEGKAFEIGIIYSSLGEADSALVWFNRAVDNREFSVLLMDVNVMTDNLRKDPRYPALKGRIGL